MTLNSRPSIPRPSRFRHIGLFVALIALALLALLAWRVWQARSTEQMQINSIERAASQAIALAPGDVARAQVQLLIAGLPVTGTLRARDTALIKARVPGLLNGLTVREGDPVHEDQVIARVDPTEYDQRYQQAQLQSKAAQAQVDIAQRQYDNNEALVKQGFISQTALATSRANLDAAQANYRAAQAGAAVVRTSLADTVLKTPIDGTVSRRLAQPGERVSPEQPVVEIVDLSQLELQATISPSDSLAVRVGQSARLTVEGVPDTVTATVTRINPSAQEGSRNVLVYFSVPAQAGLRQGLFAQGMLSTQETRRLAVPLDAVRTDKPQPYVQVVRGGRIHQVPVEPGVRGVVSHDAANAASNEGEGEIWVAFGGPADATSEPAASEPASSAGSQPGAAPDIHAGDWVLRGTAGALAEGTAVALPLRGLQVPQLTSSP